MAKTPIIDDEFRGDSNAWRKRYPEKFKEAKKRCTEKHKEKYRETAIWRRVWREFRLSKDDYYKMNFAQGGLCAICQLPPEKGRLYIDHDHKTNKVRALLCHSCNLMLGQAKDDKIRLERAIEYLRLHGC